MTSASEISYRFGCFVGSAQKSKPPLWVFAVLACFDLSGTAIGGVGKTGLSRSDRSTIIFPHYFRVWSSNFVPHSSLYRSSVGRCFRQSDASWIGCGVHRFRIDPSPPAKTAHQAMVTKRTILWESSCYLPVSLLVLFFRFGIAIVCLGLVAVGMSGYLREKFDPNASTETNLTRSRRKVKEKLKRNRREEKGKELKGRMEGKKRSESKERRRIRMKRNPSLIFFTFSCLLQPPDRVATSVPERFCLGSRLCLLVPHSTQSR